MRLFLIINSLSSIKDICLLSFYNDKITHLIIKLDLVLTAIKFNIWVKSTYIKQTAEECQDIAFKTKNSIVFQMQI